MGEAGEGRTSPTSRRSSSVGRCGNSGIGSISRSPTTRSTTCPFYKPAEDSAELALSPRAPCRLGRVSARPSGRRGRSSAGTGAVGVQVLRKDRRSRRSRPPWASCAACMADRDKTIKDHIVPIVADEARTFGMEGMFRQVGIYAPSGQLYDAATMPISWLTTGRKSRADPAGGDHRGGVDCRPGSPPGPLRQPRRQHDPILHLLLDVRLPADRRSDLGGGRHAGQGLSDGRDLGRTTLNGEGLQHQDGHSHLMSSTVPNCRRYDPTFAYELAVIVQDGLRRMYADRTSIFYYITLLERELRARRRCPRASRRAFCAACICCRRRGQEEGPRVS